MWSEPELIKHEINYKIPKIQKKIPEMNNIINRFRNDIYGFEKEVKNVGHSIIHDLRFKSSALKNLSEPFAKNIHIFPRKI